MKIYIAQSIGDSAAPELNLEGIDPFPKFKDPSHSRSLHWSQGRDIAQALLSSLPEGTVDTLLIHLLEATRSQLIVPYKNVDYQGGGEWMKV